MQTGAVVLAGGRSTRMGRPKAHLEWHGSTLLRRVVGLAGRGARGPVVVVRAPGQDLPALPAYVEVVDDPGEGLGPLQGLAAGLAVLQDRTAVAFACATDLPLLHPAYVRFVLAAIADADAVVPHLGGHPQPLAAAYRTALAPSAQRLVDAGRPRVMGLLEDRHVVVPDQATLRADPDLAAWDPGLDSVRGCNDPDAYARARSRPAPEVAVVGRRRSRAATLGALAAGLGGVPLEVLELEDGWPPDHGAQTPLCAGDVIRIGAASARNMR